MNGLLWCQAPADSWSSPSEVWRVIKPACAVTILPNQPWHCLYLPRRPSKKLGHPPSSSLPTPHQPGSHQAKLILTLNDVLKLFSYHCQDISSQSDYAVPCMEKFFHLLVNVIAPTVNGIHLGTLGGSTIERSQHCLWQSMEIKHRTWWHSWAAECTVPGATLPLGSLFKVKISVFLKLIFIEILHFPQWKSS